LGKGQKRREAWCVITRHPFLWGIALWALVHLIINGDLASLILFGSLLLLAVGGTLAIDARRGATLVNNGPSLQRWRPILRLPP